MNNDIHAELITVLKEKPKQLTDLEQWLYVTVNTAKAIIDNYDKNALNAVSALAECSSAAELQQRFDIIQGKFGRGNFSERHSPDYIYLCSLVADFPDRELTDADRETIGRFCKINSYLLYEI